MAIKISNSTIIDDSRNIVNAGVATLTSVSIGNTQVISSARQLQNIASLDAVTTATIESVISNAPNTFTDLNVTGVSTLGITSATSLTSQQLNVSGVSTLGVITATSLYIVGVVTATTFNGNATSATYASNSGIATNIKGGLTGNIPYQSSADTTVFLANGAPGTVLQSNGIGATPSWVSAAAASAISGLTIRDSSDNFVGSSGSITQLTFGPAFSLVGTTGAAGIATINLSSNIAGVGLSISGIATISVNTSTNALRITQEGSGNALIVEDSSNPDSSPFVITNIGSIGIGTTNPTAKLYVEGDTYIAGILTANRIFSNVYGEFTGGGISGTNIVGTALSISGISTFTSGPILIGTASSTGTSSQLLQVTGGTYVSGNIGVAVTSPSFAVDVSGDTRVQSTGKMRFGGTTGTTNFYIQYNSTTNSLDFVAG